MNNELHKNAEGYTDPTAAATLNRPEPGDIWEYNGTRCLIIKNHGHLSTILQLTDKDHPANVKVMTRNGPAYTNARLVTYGQHTKMGRYVETVSVKDFKQVIEAVEAALGLNLQAREEADAQDVQNLRKKLDAAQVRILELEDQLDDYEGTVLGLERQLAAATNHINNGAVDKAQAEAAKARNQLELLREMYNDLLAKVVGEW